MSDYYGFTTQSVANPFFTLEVLKSAGPPLVRLIPIGTELNLFAEVPQVHWPSPAGEFYPLGGHRLWAAPERPEVTYLPDGEGASLIEIPGGFKLTRQDHFTTHYERSIEVTLDPAAPVMALKQTITNLGDAPLPAAPWGVTQFRMGGRVVLPLADKPADAFNLTPNRSLALWPYTRLEDSRLKISDQVVEIKAEPMEEALKVGVYSPRGWAAIEFAEGYVLIKRNRPRTPEVYTDFNTNWQCYVRDTFIELETLGKLTLLQPGESISLVEDWEVRPGTLASLDLS